MLWALTFPLTFPVTGFSKFLNVKISLTFFLINTQRVSLIFQWYNTMIYLYYGHLFMRNLLFSVRAAPWEKRHSFVLILKCLLYIYNQSYRNSRNIQEYILKHTNWKTSPVKTYAVFIYLPCDNFTTVAMCSLKWTEFNLIKKFKYWINSQLKYVYQKYYCFCCHFNSCNSLCYNKNKCFYSLKWD